MRSSEPATPLAATEREALRDLAWRAVRAGLDVPWIDVDLGALPPRLSAPGASFVSLHRDGKLRGCMGRLEPTRPLAEDVAGNARAAAFFDPRFPPLAPAELDGLELEISVLGAPEPLPATDEADLLRRLRPGVDGLIVEAGGRRATFRPAVWRQIPAPGEFVGQLRKKAGISERAAFDRLSFRRYRVESIPG
jgi:AmmeMemoRadiSam system protein A